MSSRWVTCIHLTISSAVQGAVISEGARAGNATGGNGRDLHPAKSNNLIIHAPLLGAAILQVDQPGESQAARNAPHGLLASPTSTYTGRRPWTDSVYGLKGEGI